ncbi:MULTISPECIES: hypothetical protein [unclassified Streptomyces]|uniref:hypothetical protein n=1 Tax=unclassified Streptomyces TaxID=2593676 RepID=UPI000DC7C295|nr:MULTISPECIES: hypothetical protein [unclassified Streptomyces]AWZ08206.1 hypothetical protein DRB89_30470 [Streptomyces sp. ICC4]AWZ16009.1 hypothetical protein DRB96_31375 [Streptomyces sp. ICC1]
MARTTPPRPVDVTAHFPELAPLARTALRLHPRAGAPTAADSSIGGPLLWPAREPWPTCPEHRGPSQHGLAPEDVRLRRRILAEAWRRPREKDADLLSAEERATVDRAGTGSRIPLDGPVPMVPVAQFYAADMPGLPRPDGTDLLQVLWCAFDHHEDHLPRAALRWRTAADVTDPLGAAPRPPVVGSDTYLPEPCVLHPETVTEYPAPHELGEELARRIEAWEDEHAVAYQYDLCVAPGCKVGGHAPWSFSDPFPMACPECGADVRPLLTIDGSEWDGGSGSWRPVEDAGYDGLHSLGPAHATQLDIGRGYSMQLYVCTASYDHPHVQNMQ